MIDSSPSTKIDLLSADKKIIFRVTSCCVDNKDHSLYSHLDRSNVKDLLQRLKHFEQLTWKQILQLSRESGITPEIKNSDSYNMIHDHNHSPSKVTEQYYFHFRVKPKSLFRVFGYQLNEYFFITHLDVKGKIHH